MSAPLEFYYFPWSPPSRGVWMTLEDLGIDYKEHLIEIFKGQHKTEEYKKISFRQRIPAIKRGDFTLAESRAVAGFLVNEYGSEKGKQNLYPQDPLARAKLDQHLYISESTYDDILAYVNIGGVFAKGEQTSIENVDKAKNALQQVEELLGEKAFVAGDHHTIADFFYYVAISLLSITDFKEWCDFPKVVAWKQRMAALPQHKKTCEEPLASMRAAYQSKLKESSKK